MIAIKTTLKNALDILAVSAPERTGSSTTGIMALELGRKFIGIDLEKEYLDLSVKRFEQVFSKKDKAWQ